jgi:hypothetical protein
MNNPEEETLLDNAINVRYGSVLLMSQRVFGNDDYGKLYYYFMTIFTS